MLAKGQTLSKIIETIETMPPGWSIGAIRP